MFWVVEFARYLWNSQGIHKLADAALAAAQEIEDAQPRRIGHGPKYQVNGVGRFRFHIRLCKYNAAARVGKIAQCIF
jgi:hypothetical protein